MLAYRLRRGYLEGTGRYFLLLPKLATAQLALLEDRLRSHGFLVTDGERTRARTGGLSITIDPSGVAWSNTEELVDHVAPAIPSILRVGKEEREGNPYFLVKRRGSKAYVQFFPRVESLRTWRELRRADLSGLTPDESEAASFILRRADGTVKGITDYPREGCSRLLIGRRAYFESRLGVDEYLSNLRTTEGKKARNSYLPMGSVLELQGLDVPSREEVRAMCESLGEWCYLRFS